MIGDWRPKEVVLYMSSWNPDIWVHKGHAKLNMFPVFLNKLRAYTVNSLSLTVELTTPKKCTFIQFFENSYLTTKPNNFDTNCQSNSESYDQHSFFWTKFRGSQNFLFTLEGFFFWGERVLWGWLPGPFGFWILDFWI